jgi:hypothetical protein
MLVVISAVGTCSPRSSSDQSAKEIRVQSPYAEIENRGLPIQIVDPPLNEPAGSGHRLDPGDVASGERALYRVREGALKYAHEWGIFHICVDDLPWFVGGLRAI